ncbi:hypothetical protein [Streptomyces achromogenes]|uniref:hypothetical protein n=1 Tax=Streptomyces achromogenes TaxID=67255 RepID=UPI00367A2B83
MYDGGCIGTPGSAPEIWSSTAAGRCSGSRCRSPAGGPVEGERCAGESPPGGSRASVVARRRAVVLLRGPLTPAATRGAAYDDGVHRHAGRLGAGDLVEHRGRPLLGESLPLPGGRSGGGGRCAGESPPGGSRAGTGRRSASSLRAGVVAHRRAVALLRGPLTPAAPRAAVEVS